MRPVNVYVYDDGTTRTEQLLNCDPLQTTLHARLLGHSFLDRSTGRLEPEMLFKFQVVHSPVRSALCRSKTGTCERVLTDNFSRGSICIELPRHATTELCGLTPITLSLVPVI